MRIKCSFEFRNKTAHRFKIRLGFGSTWTFPPSVGLPVMGVLVNLLGDRAGQVVINATLLRENCFLTSVRIQLYAGRTVTTPTRELRRALIQVVLKMLIKSAKKLLKLMNYSVEKKYIREWFVAPIHFDGVVGWTLESRSCVSFDAVGKCCEPAH